MARWKKESVLFWDEPEANLNPANISIIVEILMDFQKSGVQAFIATYDRFLAKHLDIISKEKNRAKLLSIHNVLENHGR